MKSKQQKTAFSFYHLRVNEKIHSSKDLQYDHIRVFGKSLN